VNSPRALVIAGLDPSGGAGLVLDAFVLARLGYAPSTVATTLTAQNSLTFRQAVPVAPGLLADQIEAVLAEGPVGCVKVGAAGSAENARLLGSLLRELAAPMVVDPVLASSSGGDLVGAAEVAALDALCSAATVVTPNAEEAALLAGSGDARELAAVREAGGVLARRWGCAVVVTGVAGAGGASGVELAEAVDVLCVGDAVELLAHPLVPDVGDVRGTGCMFSTALAAGLGAGASLREAVIGAQREVADLLGAAAQVGRGRMQVDLGRLGSRSSAR
jgi:hydroxymethylpyrimidine/phosphomethylpyrimidine kinase